MNMPHIEVGFQLQHNPEGSSYSAAIAASLVRGCWVQFCLWDRSCSWLCVPSPDQDEGSLLRAQQQCPPRSWGGLMSCVSWSNTWFCPCPSLVFISGATKGP